jgi:hypothetical protein
MRVAIIGGRNFDDYERLSQVITNLHVPVKSIVSGGAKGADRFAERYAEEKNIPITVFLPDWEKHGKAAGMVRNVQIVENADFLVAFWDGESLGTKHSIDLAKRKKIPYIIESF